jgi:hypothetical protein
MLTTLTLLSFIGSSCISGCREHVTAPSPRSLCLDRETTSQHPLRAPVVMSRPGGPGGRLPGEPWCPESPASSRCGLATPMDSGRIAAQWQRRYTRCAKRMKTRAKRGKTLAVAENRSYVTYDSRSYVTNYSTLGSRS